MSEAEASPPPEPDAAVGLLPPRGAARWIVVAALLVGAGLRCFAYGSPPLWLDEHNTWWVVGAPVGEGVWDRALATQTQSPFYYFLVDAVSSLAGPSPWVLRLPSILLGIATLLLAYPLGLRILRDEPAAALTTLLFALSEPLIRFSHDARPYALACALALAAFLSLAVALDRGRTGARIAWAVTAAGTFWAHYVFLPVVGVQLVYLAAVRGRSLLRDRGWLLALATLGALLAPGLGPVRELVARRGEIDWLGPMPLPMRLSLAAEVFDPPVLAATALAVALLAGAPLAPGWGGRARTPLLALWLLLPLVGLVVLLPPLGVNLVFPRYLAYLVPAILLASGRLLALVPAGRRRWTAVAAYAVAAVAFELWPAYLHAGTFSRRPLEGWSEVGAAVRGEVAEGDVLFVCGGLVESGRLGKIPLDALWRSYLSWPLGAHLGAKWDAVTWPLPRAPTSENEGYVAFLLATAARSPRAWMVGTDRCVTPMLAPFGGAGFEAEVFAQSRGVLALRLARSRER